MKNYKTPEIEMMVMTTIGDVLTYSDNGTLQEIGANGEDGQSWS